MVNRKKADEIYHKIQKKLKGQEGKIVAIDTDSGDYFVGNNELEAYNKALKEHPNKIFFFKRVGFKATYFVGCY